MTDAEGRPVQLVVAGDYHPSCDIDEMEALFCAIPSHRLARIKKRLSDQDLAELIQSVDIVFLPYLQGWNSGFAMLALGCGARLLCSDLSMFREIAEAIGPPWIYTFHLNTPDLSQELATVLSRALRTKVERSDQVRLERFLAATSFEEASSQYVELYHNIML